MSENKFLKQDRLYMAEALKLAKCGLYTTYPNPAVGCVFVRNGKIIGRGYHHKAGQPHAEIMALNDAKNDVKGATCYVTLEPCSHYGRTPPCANRLVEAGISRCVIATGDPNPKVHGLGIEILKQAAIEVSYPLLEEKARFINRAFLKSITQNIPYVSLKIGMSSDAKTALANGQSKWITCDKSRRQVQKLRAMCDVIITGSGTVISDNPLLSVRYDELPKHARKILAEEDVRQPLKVILDTRESLICENFRIFSQGKVLWVVGSKDNCSYEQALNENVTKLSLPIASDGHIDLHKLLAYLGSKNYRHALVEAGSILSTSFVNADLVDDVYLFIAPKLLGMNSRNALNLKEPQALDECLKYKIVKAKHCGEDIFVHGLIKEY